ncbi:hypothetical protein KAU45_04110 [bacterium]|nr:hypothetical protein [bacterium]
MKRLSFVVLTLALGLVLVLGCTSTTDGNGDGNGGGVTDSIEEARAIADPIADAWDPDAVNFVTNGVYVNEEGLLAGENYFWQFDYTVDGDPWYIVSVCYDGTHLEWELEIGEEGDYYDLPDYDDDHVEFLMGIASDELIEHLGEGDYMYQFSLTGGDGEHIAQVYAHPDGDSETLLAWVLLNADTGLILGRSWDL